VSSRADRQPDSPHTLADIRYAIVALGLKKEEVAKVILDSSGVAVDANGTADFLRTLNAPQLEAIWERLSNDPRWGHRNDGVLGHENHFRSPDGM
jgi:hypothetical protein